ncbi:MAG TPA: crotonase/enoyl-CoA hydratase family protein [Acidimicrobiales bacterium]
MSDRFSSDVLSIDVDGHVATLWLDRPAARNALGPAFWADLPRAMAELAGDDRVRAVVVAARGPHFSVGLDLKTTGALLAGTDASPAATPSAEASSDAPSEVSPAARARATRATVVRLQAAITAVADCPKPVVAAVHGYCIGGGVDLIAACDIRLASADAVFSVREAKVAIVADLGSLQRLPRIVGAGHVAELAFTGKDIDADRAMRIGLVNDVLPDADAVLAAARSLATAIAANSPVAVQGTKAVLAANDGRTVADGLDYVATWNAGMLASDDLTEAMTAFIEKRPPNFTGQ